MLCAGLLITGCQKSDDESATPASTNNGGGGNGGFTPPTTSFWKINGVENSASNDAVSVNLDGNQMGLAKPFTDAGFGYCHLNVFTDNSSRNLRSEVPEGGYIDLPITKVGGNTDSIYVEMDVDAGSQGMFHYRVESGLVHVSKSGGKLRFTSNGVYTMSGLLYPGDEYVYSCQMEFSQVEP